MKEKQNILIKVTKLNLLLLLIFCFNSFYSNAQSSFSGQRIKALAEKYIKSIYGENSTPILLIEPNDIKFEEGNIKAKFEFKENNNSAIQKLYLAFYSKEKYIKSFELPFRIKKTEEVIVAKRDIMPNEVLTYDDVLLEKVEVSNVNDIITDYTQINNKILKRRVKAGDIIRKSFLDNPKIIKRGQLVTLKVISGTVSITTTGTVLQDGATGDIVRVRRVDDYNNSVFEGKVSENGEVLISLK